MMYPATVFLVIQITSLFLVVVFVIAFIFGFVLKIQKTTATSKNQGKLVKEKKVNKERITELSRKLEELQKKNSSLKNEEGENAK
ncbi:MAG TPA: hypothetical protein VHB48_18035, partial [Chitinophagaceae bacterium]|nr:hypothetical protein [Chitinophagaceae bacterium]